jgi:hypothetical protein
VRPPHGWTIQNAKADPQGTFTLHAPKFAVDFVRLRD